MASIPLRKIIQKRLLTQELIKKRAAANYYAASASNCNDYFANCCGCCENEPISCGFCEWQWFGGVWLGPNYQCCDPCNDCPQPDFDGTFDTQLATTECVNNGICGGGCIYEWNGVFWSRISKNCSGCEGSCNFPCVDGTFVGQQIQTGCRKN